MCIEKIQQARHIRLEVPDTAYGRWCAPPHHVPSVVLSRTERVTDTAPSDASPDVTLVLGRRIGVQGRWDVYYARCKECKDTDLVIKALDISFFPTEGPYARQKTIDYFEEEYEAIGILLQSLQGTCVPRLGGMFASGWLHCTVYEDAGRPLTEDEMVDEAILDKIVATVEAVHTAGVAVMRNRWREIRIKDGCIKFGDFYCTTTLRSRGTRLDAMRGKSARNAGKPAEYFFPSSSAYYRSVTYDFLRRRVEEAAADKELEELDGLSDEARGDEDSD